jgi:tetratricopeptide (TPR) repeat protein
MGAGTLSSIFVHAGLTEPALKMHARLEAAAARRPDLPLVQAWRAWAGACILDIQGAPAADVLRETERSLELYRGVANHRTAFFCDGQAAVLIEQSGDAASAIARLRRTIRQAEELNEHYLRAWLSCILAQFLAAGPSLAEAFAITDTIVEMGVAPPCPAIALGLRARALLAAGRVAEALETAQSALDRLAWAPGFAAVPAAVLVEALARQGRADEAVQVGERWSAKAPPNTTAHGKRAALRRALDLARAQVAR